jgi:hypothetical protein
VTHQPAKSFSISFQHPFNRAGGRTSNVRGRLKTMPAHPDRPDSSAFSGVLARHGFRRFSADSPRGHRFRSRLVPHRFSAGSPVQVAACAPRSAARDIQHEQAGTYDGGQRACLNSGFPLRRAWPRRCYGCLFVNGVNDIVFIASA